MHLWLADAPFFGGPGQGPRQIVELFVAFGLTTAPAVLAGIDGVTGIRQLDDDPD